MRESLGLSEGLGLDETLRRNESLGLGEALELKETLGLDEGLWLVYVLGIHLLLRIAGDECGGLLYVVGLSLGENLLLLLRLDDGGAGSRHGYDLLQRLLSLGREVEVIVDVEVFLTETAWDGCILNTSLGRLVECCVDGTEE